MSSTDGSSADDGPGTAGGAGTFLRAATPGTRVVARFRIPGGFSDALGYLRECDQRDCVIATRRGELRIPLSAVVAAKQVPEPPPRRGAD